MNQAKFARFTPLSGVNLPNLAAFGWETARG